MGRLQIDILGPFGLRIDGRPVHVTAGKQRILLTMLALEAGRPVSRDRLIDALWGASPPATVDTGLNVLVSRVRRTLGDASPALERAAAGYVLALEPGDLDAERFERLHEQGVRELSLGDAGEARRRLGDALALWRGRALGEFAEHEFAQAPARRLEERRATALEDRIDAELAGGEDGTLVAELQSLVSADPLRERLHGQLMLALYRSGRQAEALETYRRLHRLLDAELGVEPGPALKRLHDAMLRQDPELAPARPARAAVRAPPARRRPRLAAPLLVAAAAVAVAAGLLAATARDPHREAPGAPRVVVPAGALVVMDPRTGERTSTLRVGTAPSAVAVGPSGAWVVVGRDHTVARVDPVRRTVTDTVGLGVAATDIAVGESGVWVSSLRPAAVIRLDPELGVVGTRVPVAVGGAGRGPIAVGAGSVWATRDLSGLERIAPRADRVVARVPLVSSGGGIAVGAGAVWVPTLRPRGIARVPIAGGPTRMIGLRSVAADVAFAAGSAWAAIPREDRVVRIDPVRLVVTASLRAGDGPARLAAGSGGIWVAAPAGRSLSRIDPAAARVIRSIRLTATPGEIALGAGALWVTTQPA